MKAVKIFIGVVLALVVTVGIFLWALFGAINTEDSLPHVVDFNPTRFDYRANQPIYYSVREGKNSRLFYSKDGTLSDGQKIWTGDMDYYQSVAPNSEYIAIGTRRNTLILLDKRGTVIREFSSFKGFLDQKQAGGTFYRDSVQWSPDSDSLVLYRATYQAAFPQEVRGTGVLVKYNLKTGEQSDWITGIYAADFFLSNDGKSVYYNSFDTQGAALVVKHDVASHTEKVISSSHNCYRDDKGKEITSDPSTDLGDRIFINYETSEFGTSITYTSPDGHTFIRVEDGIHVYRDGRSNRIIEIGDGYNAFKGNSYNVGLNGAYFLPGNRYFLMYDTKTQENDQAMVLDTHEGRYALFDGNVEVHFSLTSRDSVQAEVRCGQVKGRIPETPDF